MEIGACVVNHLNTATTSNSSCVCYYCPEIRNIVFCLISLYSRSCSSFHVGPPDGGILKTYDKLYYKMVNIQ